LASVTALQARNHEASRRADELRSALALNRASESCYAEGAAPLLVGRQRERLSQLLDGVGPARRRALLRHFGSAERILDATAEELEGVPGVPAKTARSIYAQLHRAGRA